MIDEPRGMGGWLLFFTVTLAARTVLGLVNVLGTLSVMSQTTGSKGALGALAGVSFIVAVYSGWVAWVLWRLKPTAVHLLPSYFTCLAVYGVFLIALPYVPHDASVTRFLANLGPGGIAMLVYVGVWIRYFKASRRVANTFPPVAAA